MFFVVMFSRDIKMGFKKSKIKKMLKFYAGMKMIEPESKVTIIKQTNVTFLDTQKDQFNRLQSLGVV